MSDPCVLDRVHELRARLDVVVQLHYCDLHADIFQRWNQRRVGALLIHDHGTVAFALDSVSFCHQPRRSWPTNHCANIHPAVCIPPRCADGTPLQIERDRQPDSPGWWWIYVLCASRPTRENAPQRVGVPDAQTLAAVVRIVREQLPQPKDRPFTSALWE